MVRAGAAVAAAAVLDLEERRAGAVARRRLRGDARRRSAPCPRSADASVSASRSCRRRVVVLRRVCQSRGAADSRQRSSPAAAAPHGPVAAPETAGARGGRRRTTRAPANSAPPPWRGAGSRPPSSATSPGCEGGGLPGRHGAGHERGPSVHQPAPLVEQIAARVAPLDRPADHVRKGHLRHVPRRP